MASPTRKAGIVSDRNVKTLSTAALKAMLMKNSGASVNDVSRAIDELKRRGEKTPPKSMVTGGRIDVPDKGIEIAKGGMMKTQKLKMADGGMAYGKKHMYVGGGSVTMNPGLKALKESGPKGKEAFEKITGKNA